jgi:hypothetical protein
MVHQASHIPAGIAGFSILNVKEATRKANESLTGSGHDDELA